MKIKHLSTMTVLFVLAMGTFALASTEGSWFDMENCGFCKYLAAEPGLLDQLGWEYFLIKSGLLSITNFPDAETKAAYGRARAKMEEVGKKMEAGETVPMCNFCMSSPLYALDGSKIVTLNLYLLSFFHLN